MAVRQMDGVLIGTMAGMIASVIKSISNLAFYHFGLVKITYLQMAASVFVSPHEVNVPFGVTIGVAADLIFGGALGLTILIIFRVFGRDLWWYKGIVAGNVIWIFASGLAVNTFARLVPLDPLFRLISLLEHQVYGLSAAFLIWRWTKPKVKR